MARETNTNPRQVVENQDLPPTSGPITRGEAVLQTPDASSLPSARRQRRARIIALPGTVHLHSEGFVTAQPESRSSDNQLRSAVVFLPLAESSDQANRDIHAVPALQPQAGKSIRVWRLPSASVRRRVVRHHGEGGNEALFGEFGSRENLSMAQTESSVVLPERYKKYAGENKMNLEDFAFFEDLLGTFGISEHRDSEQQEAQQFSAREFMTACEQVRTYIMDLRERMRSTRNPSAKRAHSGGKLVGGSGNLETPNPADDRVNTLLQLFLHYPRIRREYIKIHAQKMASALPEFSERLSGIVDVNITNRDAYLQLATNHMDRSMMHASFQLPEDLVDTLGMFMGYQLNGSPPAEIDRRVIFAATGDGVFTNVLGQVIARAVSEGKDIHAMVRQEFLTREGIAFILARTHIESFKRHAGKAVFGQTLSDNWDSVKSTSFVSGSCPAIATMPSADGSTRPIMYEYAASILHKMPERFLKGE